MGSKGGKPQTIGYHYKWAMHFAWTDAADALLRIRAGGKDALVGRITENTSVNINKPNLWGGEKAQGGVVSVFDVLFGGDDQAPSSYLAETFGPKQSGNRGVVSTILRGGRYGAFVANPKTMEGQWERIHADSLGWYPEKAAISIADGLVLPGDATGWKYQVTAEEADPGHTNLTVPASGWSSGGQAPFGNGVTQSPNTDWPKWTTLWIKRTIKVPPGRSQTLHVTVENGCVVFIDGVDVGAINRDNDNVTDEPSFDFPLVGGQTYELAIKAFDEAGHIPTSATLLTASTVLPGITAMNVAHAIYDAVFHPKMLGQPEALNGNFEEAADIFYNEGFGICAEYNSGEETIWQYIQRLCDAAGCNLNFSRVDGKFYLDVVRGGYDIESLPVITDDDIVEFKAAPFSADEAYNGVRVRWKDQAANMERVTSPVVALGRVRDAGEVRILEKKYIEIPSEYLALRRAQSDCDAISPALTRYELTVRRKFRGVRVGQPIRLQSVKRGIDAVIRLGSVSQGRLLDGRVRLVAVTDVFNMPTLSRVESSAGEFTPASEVPIAVPAQIALEAPYVELVASLPAADLAQVADDAGYLLVAAAPPGNAINYEIASATGAEEYEERGGADFCPVATIVEAAPLSGVPGTDFTITGGYLLDRVAVGSWALWAGVEAGSFELVRVDDIDGDAGTCSLGRGCADTPPIAHAAGARIWFAGDWVGSDGREYVDGETVKAKVLPRTPSDQLDPSQATEMTVEMAQRWIRPYAPAQLRLNGDAYPDQVVGDLAVTFVPRDRLLQADQLVDSEMAGVGPEDGTTYGLELYDTADESLLYSETGIASTPASIPESNLAFNTRLEVYAERDGLQSYQRCTHTFTYDSGAPNIDALIGAGPVYIAHRGAALRYPEETNVAYAGCLADALVCVEQDCVLNASGSLVCSHDLSATYVSTSSANYSALTDANVAALTIDASAWFGVTYSPITAMLFRDVLSTYKGQFVFFPEVKDGSATQMAAELTAAGIDARQAVVSSFTVADLAPAKAAGYRTMLASSGADVLAAAISNNVDYLVYEKGASSARFTDAVAAGKPVFAYTVERRVTRDALLALGVAGMYTDDPLYVSADAPIATSDQFADQQWPPGMIAALASGSNETRPTAEFRGKFYSPDAWGYDNNASTTTYRGCLQGWACPVNGDPDNDNYAVEFKVTFGAPSDGDQTRWAGFAIAATDQAFLDGANGTPNPNGYHFLMRKNGALEIYKRNSTAGTLLSANTDSAAIADDAEIAFRLVVTPTKLRLERLDGLGGVIAAVESGDLSAGYRGGYFHLGHSRLPVKFREVNVVSVPTIPWTMHDLASPPAFLYDHNSPVTDAGSGACSAWGGATQSTAGSRPLIVAAGLNGHRVIDADGTADCLDIPSSLFGTFRNTGKAWMAALHRLDATDGANTERPLILFSVGGSANTRVGLFASPSNAANKLAIGGRRLDADTFYGVTSATARSQQWVMALGLIDFTARTIELWVDGVLDGSASGQFTASGNTSNTDSLRARLFGNAGASSSTFFNGKGAVLAGGAGSLPDSGEIDKIFGYMAHEFGLTANLPPGHPFKSAAPTV